MNLIVQDRKFDLILANSKKQHIDFENKKSTIIGALLELMMGLEPTKPPPYQGGALPTELH